jgi:hypothetical protein
MNQGTQGYSLTEKTRGQKSHETVPLKELKFLNKFGLTTKNLS